MKIQIRKGVFETNSSSTHALAMATKNDWDKFVSGEYICKGYPYDIELVPASSVPKEQVYDNSKQDEGESYYDYDYMTYEMYQEMDAEIIEQELNGVVAISIYEYE